MNAKIKTVLLTAFLFLLLISGLKAQDTYDFAAIAYSPIQKPQLVISYSTKPAETVELTKEETSAARGMRDFSPALKYAAGMQENGWEIMSIEGSIIYLRKKRQ